MASGFLDCVELAHQESIRQQIFLYCRAVGAEIGLGEVAGALANMSHSNAPVRCVVDPRHA